jgi:acyl-CoA thioesterase-1
MVAAGCGGKDTATPSPAATGTAPYGGAASNVPPTGGAPGGAGAAASAGAGKTLVIIGTSLTAGLGLDPKDAYPALLEAKADSAGLGWDVVNAGLSGETSAGALRRIDWLLTGPGDVIVVETGANDGLRGVDADSTRANIAELLKRVKAAKPQAKVLLVQMEAPPNLGQAYTRKFHAIYPALAKEAGIPLVPFLLEGVAGDAALNQADGIHPNEEGSKRVAANVWRALEPVLRQ